MPVGRELVEMVAAVLTRVTVPRTVPPAVKVTLPIGCAPVKEVTLTLKVTDCPCLDGFLDEVIVIVVASGLIT